MQHYTRAAWPRTDNLRTDNLSILTRLNLTTQLAPVKAGQNFRNIDWEQFQNMLKHNLARISPPTSITCQSQLDKACADLTKALQDTINT
jgi:hypothetical protein